MAVLEFPPEKVKRIEVNPPFGRVPQCEHDPGIGDFVCSTCPDINAKTDAINALIATRLGLPLDRGYLRGFVSILTSAGLDIAIRK